MGPTISRCLACRQLTHERGWQSCPRRRGVRHRRFRRAGVLHWRPNPSHNYTRNNPFDAVATIARDEFAADWIIVCDSDEFLVIDDRSLSELIAEAIRDDFSVISIPCFNMTGPAVLPGACVPRQLTLRIDRPIVLAPDQYLSDDIPAPVFLRPSQKTIARARTLVGYGPGSHWVTTLSGGTATILGTRFLHYQARDYNTFEQKIRNVALWLHQNSDLQPWFGWHWRRWVRLYEAGELRAEHARQFVTAEQAEELVENRISSHDDTVASWTARPFHSLRRRALRRWRGLRAG
jgi:Glycosyl transferase family 2